MVMRVRGMAMGSGRELAVSAAFTLLLVASILLLPSLLLTRTGGGLSSSAASTNWPAGGDAEEQYPVSFAYLISASSGDASRAARLLAALYHPGNSYLLHLDREAPAEEHRRLAELVAGRAVYARAGNVWIVGRPNLVTYRGPTMLSTTLHAVAVLLRLRRRWDWFINLSASDYPLVTQDDMIEAFSEVPRHLNFIQHTSHLGWKIKKRAKPVILDTALYEAGTSELIRPTNLTTNLRKVPTAFKVFTGSAWTMLSRPFAEYMIMGWEDNLPRTLLLYYTNFISSPEFYFQTLACNSRRFRNATVNHDLHYIKKFKRDDPVLDRIDREILRRHEPAQFSYGGWCSEGGVAMCGHPQEPDRKGAVKAGAGARRLKALLSKTMSPRNMKRQQCR
ncbi:hypothetical protein PR202_gb08111 [Eleusine coracana subsp. coracana]|uniref:Uncharacterized protein n=1 Tax=Eleusine coracana subsp. coracana TaxID=191504 RepID=A0AAV5EDW5_ELECO|nr:hypothetical protein PR202_gb08111 [Eleusine coracana subsp. coracana]